MVHWGIQNTERFFGSNCSLWRKEMHILAGNYVLGFLEFTAPKNPCGLMRVICSVGQPGAYAFT
jgi:hypothetical protein